MKNLFLIVIVITFGACTEATYRGNVINYPDQIHMLEMDSVYSNVVLNATGMVATKDYLIISNINRDTIFDVFNVKNLQYLYSDLIVGNGGNDMLPFRWMRTFKNNSFYTIGFGTPTLVVLDASDRLRICHREFIECEKDICQNLYPLNENNYLIQPGKKQGEWSLINSHTRKMVDMPSFPFREYETDGDMFTTFRNRAANVSVNTAMERIAFFYTQIPFMQLFDFKGNLISEGFVGEDPSDPAHYFLDDKVYYAGCTYTDEYIIAKYIPKNAPENKTYFQLWDWDGNLLQLFAVQDKINLFTVSSDGKTLFAAKNDNDYVFRCDLSSLTNSLP